MTLPVTLCAAAAAAILNIWLMMRVGKIRQTAKIPHGDGGNAALIRRMRAHLNFVESAPFVLILIGAVEISGKAAPWLAYVAALYIAGRVAHAMGMDQPTVAKARVIGIIITMLTLIGLAVAAVLIATNIL